MVSRELRPARSAGNALGPACHGIAPFRAVVVVSRSGLWDFAPLGIQRPSEFSAVRDSAPLRSLRRFARRFWPLWRQPPHPAFENVLHLLPPIRRKLLSLQHFQPLPRQ